MSQDKLRELAEKFSGRRPEGLLSSLSELEAFGRLVAEECCKIAEPCDEDGIGYEEYQATNTAKNIRAHFGLDEKPRATPVKHGPGCSCAACRWIYATDSVDGAGEG